MSFLVSVNGLDNNFSCWINYDNSRSQYACFLLVCLSWIAFIIVEATMKPPFKPLRIPYSKQLLTDAR